MDLPDLLARRGGLATRAELVAASSRAEVDAALARGVILRVGRGRYALPTVATAARVAHAMSGVLSLSSAALFHGWEVKAVPARPHVLVPRKRRVPERWRGQVEIHRADLLPDDVSAGIATSRELTLAQCLRTLPDDEALSIADSALRAGEHATLRRVYETACGPGARKIRRVALAARAEAANPFESCMRAIALTVPGLRVVPQTVIAGAHVWAQPDLVDAERRLVIECDSFGWHGNRTGFRKDARRYTLLTAEGWTVLRFLWEDVMHRPGWVRDVLVRTVGADARTQPRAEWPVAA